MKQQTIKYPVTITGYGLQSGNPTTCKISPAPANSGVVFYPINGSSYKSIQSRCDNVSQCVLSTDIGSGSNTVSTIEHLMSALHSLGIDNVDVTLSGGNEIPILDGSSSMWYTLLMSAGIVEQSEPRYYTQVSESVIINEDDKWIRIDPYDGLIINCTIKFDHPMIGEQNILWDMDTGSYYHDVSLAKTFGFEGHIMKMKAMGYLKGGDEDTAVVLNDDGTVRGSLRYVDEFVRHKLLDLIGDVYINGPIKGFITSYCSGHDLNNKLMRAIDEQERQIFIGEGDAKGVGQIHHR